MLEKVCLLCGSRRARLATIAIRLGGLHVNKIGFVVFSIIPVLESMKMWFALTVFFYVCEVTDYGVVLAEIKIELPRDGVLPSSKREKFWSVAFGKVALPHTTSLPCRPSSVCRNLLALCSGIVTTIQCDV